MPNTNGLDFNVELVFKLDSLASAVEKAVNEVSKKMSANKSADFGFSKKMMSELNQVQVQAELSAKKIGAGFNSKLIGQLKNLGQDINRTAFKEIKANDLGSKSGKSFGSAFGKAMVNAVKTPFNALAKMAGNALRIGGNILTAGAAFAAFDFIGGSIGAANNADQARRGLGSTVAGYKLSQNKKLDTLANPNASLEARARAAGLRDDQIYETVSASKAATEASKEYRDELDKKEQAFKQEENAINANIRAIEKKRDAEIQAIRTSRQYYDLINKQKGQERELLEYQIQGIEAQMNNDPFAQEAADLNVKNKQLELDLTRKNIDLIDIETDKKEEQYKIEIDNLRNQLEDKELQFKIDTQFLKDQIDDVVEYAGGEMQRIRPDVAGKVEAAAKGVGSRRAIVNSFNEKDVILAANAFANSKDRGNGVTEAGAQQVFAALAQAGVTNTGIMTQLAGNFQDIATSRSDKSKPLEDAMIELAENYRNEIAAQGDINGLKDEYKSQIIPAGIEAMKQDTQKTYDVAKQLFGEEEARRIVTDGIKENIDELDENTRTVAKITGLDLYVLSNNYQSHAKSQQGAQKVLDQMTEVVKDTKVKIGDAILSVLEKNPKFVENFKGIMESVTQWVMNATTWLSVPANQDRVNKAFETLISIIEKVGNWLLNMFGGFLGTDVQKGTFLGIQMPKVNEMGQEFGKFLLPGVNLVSSFLNNSKKKSTGGLIPGFGGGDTVPAMLEPGEYVLNKDLVRHIGIPNLDRMNFAGFGNSGSVDNSRHNQMNNYSLSVSPYSASFAQ